MQFGEELFAQAAFRIAQTDGHDLHRADHIEARGRIKLCERELVEGPQELVAVFAFLKTGECKRRLHDGLRGCE